MDEQDATLCEQEDENRGGDGGRIAQRVFLTTLVGWLTSASPGRSNRGGARARRLRLGEDSSPGNRRGRELLFCCQQI